MRAVPLALLCFGLMVAAEVRLLGDPLYGRELPSQIVTDFQLLGGPFPGTRTTMSYTYDQKGQVLTELEQMDTGRDGHIDSRVLKINKYDSRGNAVLQVLARDFYADEIVDETTVIVSTYSARGLPQSAVTVTKSAFSLLTTISVSFFTHDARGDLTEKGTLVFRDFDLDVDRISHVTYAYRRDGHVDSRREVVVDDLIATPLVLFEDYQYDNSFNLVHKRMETDFGGDGSLDSVTTTDSTVNARRQIEDQITRFDSNADGMAEVSRRTLRDYDRRGDLLRETETWEGGLPTLTIETSFTYDTAGRLIAREVRRDLTGDGVPEDVSMSQYVY